MKKIRKPGRTVTWKIPTAIVIAMLGVAYAFVTMSPQAKADLTDGLVGHWQFDEGSGTTAADSSGNTNTGNLVGNVTWTAGHDGGTAVQFDGVGAQATASETVNVGTGATLDNSPMHTLSAWVRFEPGYVGNGGTWANIIGSTTGFNFPYMLYINKNGHLRAHITQSNGVVRLVDSVGVVPTGQWVHVAQVADGNRLRMYINGVEDPNTITYDGTMRSYPAANTYIGQDTREFVPRGAIDDARIYSRGLTPQEVGGLANGEVHYRKTVSPEVASISPGQTFTYTVTVENTGGLDLTGLSFTDDLSDIVDDATYNNDVGATSGTATFNAPDQIAWSGDLDVGETATITYTVTMNDPATGDGELRNGVVGTGPSSNCSEDPAIDPDCLVVSPLPVISSQKTLVSPASPETDDTVNYQFTITNTGATAITGFPSADDLSGVLDDATYNNDAAASSGTLVYDPTARRLIWNGNLAASGNAGDSVTVTYSVTVNDADSLGDAMLNNALAVSDCPNPAIFDPLAPGYEANCVTSTPVTAWVARKTVSPTGATQPGSVVTYNIEVENTGAVDLTGGNAPVVDDDMTDVLDDATYNNNAAATSGTATFTSPGLNWTGDLDSREIATITYSATVKPQGSLGNNSLVNTLAGSMNCPVTSITNPNDPDFNDDCAVITPITLSSTSGSNGGGSLADTGEDTWIYAAFGGLAVIVGLGVIARRLI
jgi:uncharacterized repeat protein (TIGR01451 family)/fimbrial isopeptide formation D2 family protein